MVHLPEGLVWNFYGEQAKRSINFREFARRSSDAIDAGFS
jgi:hypothetical protein